MKGLFRVLVVLAGLAAGTLTAVPHASASVVSHGYHCEGVKAYRCAWFHYDTVNKRLRGYGSVKDTTSASVWVQSGVTLQALTSSGWTTVAYGNAVGTYEDISTTTGLADCVPGRQYRAAEYWEWGSDSGVTYSGSVAPC